VIKTPKKAWAFLEYAAERYKWVVNNYAIIDESWKYAVEIAKEENIQELQIKYTFNLWNWTQDNFIKSYDLDTSCLRPEELSSGDLCSSDKVRKHYFTNLNQFLLQLKGETGVSIHIIVGAGRPTNMESLAAALCKFNTYHSFNACLPEPLIIGYDMYGQEDISKLKAEKHTSLLASLARRFTARARVTPVDPTMLTYSILAEALNNFKEKAPNKDDISFTLHAGESYSIDRDAAGIQNLELAVNLDALRIGHGIVLKSSDRLMKIYKDKKILVELCPLSNSLLGFVNDARRHPGAFLLQKDILVSINTDNRGLLNYDYVSYDWFDLVLFSDLSNKKSRAATKDVYTNLIKIAWDSINSASSIPRLNDEIRGRWIAAYGAFIGNPSLFASSTAQASSFPFVTAVGR
jgi:adenosine deaminase